MKIDRSFRAILALSTVPFSKRWPGVRILRKRGAAVDAGLPSSLSGSR
jgi:hypothetical protein